jgi:GNAT superfamily N-acetyltransferase
MIDLLGEVSGTCDLIDRRDQISELSKMAVLEYFQSFGLGRRLAEAIIKRPRHQGARVLCLETNRRLTPAMQLYRELGFTEKPFAGHTK